MDILPITCPITFSLVDEDVILPSFFAQYGFKNKLCATDVTYVTAAILENMVN